MLRNLGIRWQILSALALPVLVLGLISSQVTYQALVDMREASQSREYAEAAGSYEDVVAALQSERALSVDVVLKRPGVQKLLALARTSVDTRLADLRAQIADDSTSDEVKQLFDSSDRAHNQLTALRADLDAGRMEQSGVVGRFTEVIDADVDMPTDLAVATRSQATAVNLQHYGQLARATEALAREQLAGTAAILSGKTVLDDRLELGTQVAASTQALATFRRTAPADQQAALKKALVAPAARSSALVSARASFQAVTSVSYLSLEDWAAITGGQLTAMRSVLAEVKQDGVGFAESDYNSARSKLQITLAAAIGITLLTLALALALSRRISAPLRRLTLAATQIRDELPKIVESVQSDEDFELHLPVVQTLGSNEVSLLAAAFVDVNAVTVDIAKEQARLRAAVADMFVNVARRNQVLLSRQLSLIDQLERNEVNPDALEELFRLDHLATRMRRNAESLLVLAGIESGRRLRDAMPLSDVVRTATSEIEHYSRVTLSLAADPPVFAHLALPVAHMLAELLENATNFSDPGSTVVVMSSSTNQGIRMTVADDGLGMSAAELVEINARIEEPPTAEALSSQRLGLFVVGRLARRLEAKVTLTSGRARGTAVLIDLPASLFMPGTVEGGSTTPAQPAVEQHSAAALPSGAAQAGLPAGASDQAGASAEPFVPVFPGAPALPSQFDAAAFDAVNALEPVWSPQPDDLPIGEEDARIGDQFSLPSLPSRRSASATANQPVATEPFAVPAAQAPVAAVHELPTQSTPQWATSDWVSEPGGTSTDASTAADGAADGAAGASLFSGFRSRQAEEAAQAAELAAAPAGDPEPSPGPDAAPAQPRAKGPELPVPVLDPNSVTFLDSAEAVDGWYDPTTGEPIDEPGTTGTDSQSSELESGQDEPGAPTPIAIDEDEWSPSAATGSDASAVESTDATQWASQSAIPEPWNPTAGDQGAEAWTPEGQASESETSELASWSVEPASAAESELPESWAPESEQGSSDTESWSADAAAWTPEPEAESWSSEPDVQSEQSSEAESWSSEPWAPESEQTSSESWSSEPAVSESWSPEPVAEAESEVESWSAEPAGSEAESWSTAEPGASETQSWTPEPAATEAEPWSPEPEAAAESESWSSESESEAAAPAAPAEMRSELSQTLTASIDILPARTTFRSALTRGRRKNDAAGAAATPFNGGFDPIAPAREFALREGFGSAPESEQEPTSGGLPAELTNIPASPISRVPEPSQPRDASGKLIERRQHPRPNDGQRQSGRSALASEALTELSRLSSYSPTSMPSATRVGLQRRTPGEVPVEEQQPVEGGGRARTAASVRSMLAGFKAGVERGRTSPSANRPATDREPPQPPQPREPR